MHQQPRPVVRVERIGQQLNLASQPQDLLNQLSTIRHRAVADADHGYRIERQHESLLHPPVGDARGSRAGQAQPTAGLEPVIWYLHLAAGRRPERRHTGWTPSPLGQGDRSWITPGMTADYPLLDFVHHHDHGVVRCGDGVDTAYLVMQIARTFPAAELAVVTSRKRTVYRLAGRLRRLLAGTTVATDKCCEPPGRVVVSTYRGLAHTAIEIEKRHIVIAVDALEGIGHDPSLALWACRSARLFGLLPSSRRLAPRDADRIAAPFGLDELEIPRHGYQRMSVRTVWSPIVGPHLTLSGNVAEHLRRGIWRNKLRNRRIATLARMIRESSRAQIAERYPEVARHLPPADTVRVLLVTESLDHALALKEHLPDWPLMTGPDVITDGLTEQQRQQQWLGGSGAGWIMPAQHIATAAGAAAIQYEYFDVVIWAGGGPCLPPIPQDRLVCPADRPHNILVVDFRDGQHPCLRRWSRRRSQVYRDFGWFPAGDDPTEGRIRRFLNSRPNS